MLIRDLESRTGLDRATIRYYEKEGLITPIRQENGYREYSQEDCENLLKIKLLRQLGMPLFKIKELQEGRADFTAAMESQLKQLEQQLQRTQQTMEVCSRIRQSESSYAGLNAAYYLSLLEQPYALKPVLPAFRESVRRERHPWRRYIARMIDIAIVTGVLEFIIIVILRIRPYNFSFVVNYVGLFLCVPVYAFCLHKWGTTPGKFVFGLRVESVNGGRLSMTDAMWREFNVLRFGMGYGIPFYELWREYKSYKQYMDEAAVDYDEDSEYFCDEFDRKKKIQLTVLILAHVILTIFMINDQMKPHFRGDLTVAEFASNYNDYIAEHEDELFNSERMNEKGEWTSYNNVLQIDFSGDMDDQNATFEFHLEQGSITAISYKNTWTNVFFFRPLSGHRKYVADVLISAQNNISLWDMIKFENEYVSNVQNTIPDGAFDGVAEGGFIYENVEVIWKIEAANVNVYQGQFYVDDQDYVSGENSKVTLYITYRLLDQ